MRPRQEAAILSSVGCGCYFGIGVAFLPHLNPVFFGAALLCFCLLLCALFWPEGR